MNGLGAQGDPRGADVSNPVTYPFKGIGGVRIRQADGRASGSRTSTPTASRSTASTPTGSRTSPRSPAPEAADGKNIAEDMSRGAEAYLQMWERAEGIKPDSCRNPSLRVGVRRLATGPPRHATRAVMRAVGQPYTRLGRDLRVLRQGEGPPDRAHDRDVHAGREGRLSWPRTLAAQDDTRDTGATGTGRSRPATGSRNQCRRTQLTLACSTGPSVPSMTARHCTSANAPHSGQSVASMSHPQITRVLDQEPPAALQIHARCGDRHGVDGCDRGPIGYRRTHGAQDEAPRVQGMEDVTATSAIREDRRWLTYWLAELRYCCSSLMHDEPSASLALQQVSKNKKTDWLTG